MLSHGSLALSIYIFPSQSRTANRNEVFSSPAFVLYTTAFAVNLDCMTTETWILSADQYNCPVLLCPMTFCMYFTMTGTLLSELLQDESFLRRLPSIQMKDLSGKCTCSSQIDTVQAKLLARVVTHLEEVTCISSWQLANILHDSARQLCQIHTSLSILKKSQGGEPAKGIAYVNYLEGNHVHRNWSTYAKTQTAIARILERE